MDFFINQPQSPQGDIFTGAHTTPPQPAPEPQVELGLCEVCGIKSALTRDPYTHIKFGLCCREAMGFATRALDPLVAAGIVLHPVHLILP